MNNNLHLVPEIVINLVDKLKAPDIKYNEKINLELRLEEIVRYINSALGKTMVEKKFDIHDIRNVFRNERKKR